MRLAIVRTLIDTRKSKKPHILWSVHHFWTASCFERTKQLRWSLLFKIEKFIVINWPAIEVNKCNGFMNTCSNPPQVRIKVPTRIWANTWLFLLTDLLWSSAANQKCRHYHYENQESKQPSVGKNRPACLSRLDRICTHRRGGVSTCLVVFEEKTSARQIILPDAYADY